MARLLRATVLTVVVWVMGACARPVSPQVRVASDAPPLAAEDCRGGPVTQEPDGSLRGCLIIGQVHPGPYSLELTAFRSRGNHPRGATIIRVEPTSGPPGTRVTIEGRVDGARGDQTTATVCWAGCTDGLAQHQRMEWSGPRTFTTTVTVPAVPWLARTGPRAPIPGDYPVEVDCIYLARGCVSARTTFRLTASGHTAVAVDPCAGHDPCGEIHADREVAEPGDVVRFHGWAPLAALGGGLGYRVVLGAGSPLGEGVQIRPDAWGDPMPFLPTALRVRSPVRWAELGDIDPVLIQRGDHLGLRLAPDPSRPEILAYCDGHTTRYSLDAGTTWQQLPTDGIIEAPPPKGGPAPAACGAVPDPRLAGTLFAYLAAPTADYETPPAWSGAFITHDAGQTWRPVPVPDGMGEEDFAGFFLRGSAVQARYAQDDEETIRETVDGGRTWRPADPGCPGKGACIAWGRVRSDGPCLHTEHELPIRYSTDGGRSFHSPDWPAVLDSCWPASIASLTDGRILLLDGNEVSEVDFPLRISRDGGRTWRVVALPALPGTGPNERAGWLFPRIGILPDGRLFTLDLFHEGKTPYLLAPGGSSWCAATDFPMLAMDLHAVGDEVWWREPPTAADPIGPVQHTPVSQVRCE